jgi:DNA-binding transcriptional ArsR family regulator
MSQPAISRHLKVLERAGLIERSRSAQARPSTLRVERLRQATEWIETRRATWERRMDRLDQHLEDIQKGTRR